MCRPFTCAILYKKADPVGLPCSEPRNCHSWLREEWVFEPTLSLIRHGLTSGGAVVDRQQIEQRVTALAEDVAGDMGLTVVDVIYRGGRGAPVLEVCLDRGGRLTLDDCAEFNRALGDVLDAEGLLDVRYRLEVASPGLNRVLKTEREYSAFEGRAVEVSTIQPIDGTTVFRGVLRGISDGELLLEADDGETLRFPVKQVSKTRLYTGF